MDPRFPNNRLSKPERVEFALLTLAVFFSPFETFRHPAFFFTVSDFFFCGAIAMRLYNGMPLLALGGVTYLWLSGFVLMNLGLLISSLINGNPADALIVFVQYLFAYICLPYVICSRTYRQAVFFIKCSLWAMLTLCVFGIVAYYLGLGEGAQVRHFVIVTGAGRLTSLVTNPNGFASIVAFTFPLLWFLSAIREVNFWLLSISTIIFAWALVLASSNTGFMIVAGAAPIFVLGQGKIRTFAIASLLLGSLGLVTVLWGDEIFPEIFQRRVLHALMDADVTEAGTFTDRYDLIKEAWRMAENNVLIGLGVDQYRLISEQGLPVHNTYLLLLNEGGIVALAGFLIILGSYILVPLLSLKQPHGYLIFILTLSLVLAYAFVANSLTHIYARFMMVPLMLAVGIASSLNPQYRNAPG